MESSASITPRDLVSLYRANEDATIQVRVVDPAGNYETHKVSFDDCIRVVRNNNITLQVRIGRYMRRGASKLPRAINGIEENEFAEEEY